MDVLLLSFLLYEKTGTFCATMNKESEGFFYVRKANFPTHGIVAGEEFPHHVGRDDSARRGRNRNSCYLHDALRVQDLLYGLK